MDFCASLTGVLSAFLRRKWGLNDVHILWEFPPSEHGDIATPLAFHLAKHFRESPVAIAERLMREIQRCPGVERSVVAGAGYVNVWLTPDFLLQGLVSVHQACTPRPLLRDHAPVIIDYPSPNIAKPLGVHHILVSMIGQVLANLYRHAGIPVVGWNYIGDWGTQFGKLAVAHAHWGTKPVEQCSVHELLALYVKFHDQAESDLSLEEEGRAAFLRLERGDEELRKFLDTVTDVSLREMKGIFDRLRVSFDLVRGERYYEGKMASIVEEGKKKGVFKKGEKGALIVEFPASSKLPPAIVLKSDGTTIYLTRDLALLRDRIDGWHPSRILHVVGVPQSLYFQQLFATAVQLGWDLPQLEHIAFGQMRFTDRKMSTRKGNILGLEDVLNEAVKRAEVIVHDRGGAIQTDDPKGLAEMMGIGAVVYGVLSQNRKMDIVFDWDRMLSFEGNSAPYLQYTHARARSVLRKAGGEGAGVPVASSITPAERILLVQLLQFSCVLQQSRDDRMPHKLCQYLFQLCQAYNAFYNVDPILTASSPVRDVRVSLTACTASVLRTGAELLTLQVPDRM